MSRLHAARCRHYRGKPKTLCDHDVLFGSNALIVKDPSLGARAECQCLGAVLFPSAHDLQSSLVGFPGSGLGVSRERHFLMQVADSQSLRTDLERCCDLQHSSLRIDVGSEQRTVRIECADSELARAPVGEQRYQAASQDVGSNRKARPKDETMSGHGKRE